MSISYNTKIPVNGLKMMLDASNVKSVPYQNLLKFSEQWATSPWSSYNSGSTSTVTNNSGISPDGKLTASLYNVTVFGSGASIYNDPVESNGIETYRVSFYFKPGTMTATISPVLWFFTGGISHNGGININPQTGAITGGSGTNKTVIPVGNGWFRASFIYTGTDPLNTKTRFEIYHNGIGTMYYWGAQVTHLDAPENYIKTESSAIINHGVWYDLSGNGNNVVSANTPTHSSQSFLFNGSSQYFYQQSLVSLPQTIKTVICWTKPDSTGPTNTYTGLVSWGSRSCPVGSSTSILLSMSTANTYYVSSAYWCNDYVPNTSEVQLNKDQWNMTGIIARGSGTNNTTLFKYNSSGYNFVTGSSSTNTNTFLTSNQDLRIGCTDGAGRFMKGNISAVLIYDRELSSLEISSIISAFRSRYGI